MNTENREINPGETMFDYLKRKKKLLLEKTLKSNSQLPKSPLREKHMNSTDLESTKRGEESLRETSRDRTKRDEGRDRSTLKESNESLTRRNQFAEQERKPIHRSFIQMISPNRSKSPVREAEKNVAIKQGSRRESKDNFTRKVLTEKVNLMRDTIETQLRGSRSLKEKSHSLFLDLKPFLRHVEDCPESGLERKTEEIKAKIRVLESIFKELSNENHQSSIQEFYLHFSQYLNELQGQAKAQICSSKDSLTAEIEGKKNREIEELTAENCQLSKDLSILSKRYSKLEREHEQQGEQTSAKAEQSQGAFRERVGKLEAELAAQKQQNALLAREVQEVREEKGRLEEERRQLVAQRQRFEEECLSTITRVKSEQEEFLLNEIMVLKKEFNADISKMAELYKVKEEDLLRRMAERDRQIAHLNKNVSELLQGNRMLEESLAAVQAQSLRVKKHNECLSTDMHRINEELYQHWLALKDIKTLSQRLDIFPKFKKIYDELLFNEQLFL